MVVPAPHRALALSRLPLGLDLGPYQRFYFGAEFCYWAMPAIAEICRARTLAREAAVPFTLMTPVLNQWSLRELDELFTLMQADWLPGDELLISDLGTLEPARASLPDAEIVLGRALSGQKRGPRIETLETTPAAADYFRQGRWYSAEAVALLGDYGIDRIELDNLLQGVAPLPVGLKGSLHLPWLMVTSSSNCPYHAQKNGRRCFGGCGEVFTLKTAQTSHPLFQAGNTQFVKNGQIPAHLFTLGIDRIVEHPQLPK